MEVAAPSSTIVSEVLKENNYEKWSIFMKHYLVAQDLWDIIQSDQMPKDENTKEWVKKNALALHAIKISCGAKAFDRIKKMESAKCAWDVLGLLVNVQESPVVNLNIGELHEVISPEIVELYETGPDTFETGKHEPLLNWICNGNLQLVKNFLSSNPHAISARILQNGYTALHVAISVGNPWIVEEMITMARSEDLEKKDHSGNTALALAASNGMMSMAKCLIEKNKNLLIIPDNNGKIPVMLACGAGHEDMARYLYCETPLLHLEGDINFCLLQECITKKMFDIAVDLVDLVQGLEFRCPSGSIPIILTLAQTPAPFFKKSQLGFWGRLIYNSIRAKADFIKPRDQQSCAQKIQHFYQSCAQKIQHFYQSCAQTIQCVLDLEWPGLCGALPGKLLYGLIVFPFVLLANAKSRLIALASLILGTLVSVLARFLAKHIYNLKLMDLYARKFIRCICDGQLSRLDHYEFVQSGAIEATFQAIKNGIPEIAIAIIQANANIIWSRDPEDSRNMFACAVLHRQEKLARFLYEFGVSKDTNAVFSIDEDGNNTLHLAAKLAHDSHLSCISGAALKLQSELRWFKAVEGVVPQFCSEQKNKDSQTPSQLFIKEHEGLLTNAAEWMKKKVESSTVVAALIITIMFAAAFTVPGGNEEGTGFPIFLSKKPVPFMVFIVSDAISLFVASSAALIFLAILTSDYAYEDFLNSLRKLMIALSFLFISIATMMVAFCAALYIMLRGRLRVVIPITLLAGIPVTLFVFLQSPLLFEIYVLTFSSDIFDRKRMKYLSKRSEFRAIQDKYTLSNTQAMYGIKYLPSLVLGALWRIFCVWE